jgi:hypothetical protein
MGHRSLRVTIVGTVADTTDEIEVMAELTLTTDGTTSCASVAPIMPISGGGGVTNSSCPEVAAWLDALIDAITDQSSLSIPSNPLSLTSS